MTGLPRFGVNYVPSTGWWYSWIDWNEDALREDLAAVAAIGVDHIRVHCLWPVFQPNPTMVSPTMLQRLGRLLDLAETAELDVVVTVFDGWLSGFDFRPSWLGEGVNIFTDPDVVAAERRLLDALAAQVADHPRFLGFDLANEPNVLATPTRNITDRQGGDAWVEQLLTHCQQIAPAGVHCVGMDHRPWLVDDEPFSRSTLARAGDVTPIHAWIYFTGALARYGAAGTGTIHLAEYMLELAKAYAVNPGRQVWLQEYGASTEWLDSPADFLESATRAALTVNELWGITWWCSHDISRSLGGFVDLEYDLGLLTVDNRLKPAGERLRGLLTEVRAGRMDPPPARTTALVLDDRRTPDLEFADEFFALIDRGIRPAIVLRSRAADTTHLAARGIEQLTEPRPMEETP